jgi:hypothetical protein
MGQLVATPVGGGNPLPFGALQDVGVDISGDIKQLYGTKQFALDVARGKVKIDIKAKWGLIDPNIYNSIFFGQTVTTGETLAAFNEAGTVPGSTTYTVTAANGATFLNDLGVYYATTGAKLTQVAAGSEAVGKYSVSAVGVYTFAAADANKAVLLNYTYGSTTTGNTLAVTNQLMGSIPSFQVILANTDKGKTQTLVFYNCVASKLSMPFKQDDYEITEVDFMAQDDGTGRVFSWTATGG